MPANWTWRGPQNQTARRHQGGRQTQAQPPLQAGTHAQPQIPTQAPSIPSSVEPNAGLMADRGSVCKNAVLGNLSGVATHHYSPNDLNYLFDSNGKLLTYY